MWTIKSVLGKHYIFTWEVTTTELPLTVSPSSCLQSPGLGACIGLPSWWQQHSDSKSLSDSQGPHCQDAHWKSDWKPKRVSLILDVGVIESARLKVSLKTILRRLYIDREYLHIYISYYIIWNKWPQNTQTKSNLDWAATRLQWLSLWSCLDSL